LFRHDDSLAIEQRVMNMDFVRERAAAGSRVWGSVKYGEPILPRSGAMPVSRSLPQVGLGPRREEESGAPLSSAEQRPPLVTGETQVVDGRLRTEARNESGVLPEDVEQGPFA
jgi:hypothetical protein